MLYIRADGNTEIGMGHVMRCLSVAEAAAELDCLQPPVFVTADAGCRAMIEDRGFRAIVLNTDFRDMMSELPQLAQLFDRKSDVLLVDSYQAGAEYYRALRRLVKVACFEDMGEACPVDLLINYNIYAPQLAQTYKGAPADCAPAKILLGAAYMPLRKAFQKPAAYQVRDKVTDVMITTGGSDPYFATAAIADALCADKMIAEQGIHLHLVSGPFNQFADALRRRYPRQADQGETAAVRVTVHECVADMRSLILQSDVVISAAGSTIYEVSSAGVPMIVFYFAENQRQGAEAVARLTGIVNAGCFFVDGAGVAENIRKTLRWCIQDKAYRERLWEQERVLVDGKGARRTAGQLAGLLRVEVG